MTDLRQTKEYAQYMHALGWKVVRMGNRLYIRRIPLLGSVAKLQRPKGKIPARELDRIAKQHNLAVLYVEPSVDLRFKINDSGFQRARACFLPSKTIQIDLTQSEEKILQGVQKRTRYAIRQAEKNKLKVSTSHNMELALKRNPSKSRSAGRSGIEGFIKLWQKTARQRGMWLPQKKEIKALWDAFGKNAHLFLAYSSPTTRYSSLVAGVLLVRSATTAYYMYAASTKEGNKLSAPSLLAWEAIKLAKKNKCKIFDFEGIYDERYKQTKRWKGFTRFKEGFGGKVITYPETLVRYYNPIAKLLKI